MRIFFPERWEANQKYVEQHGQKPNGEVVTAALKSVEGHCICAPAALALQT